MARRKMVRNRRKAPSKRRAGRRGRRAVGRPSIGKLVATGVKSLLSSVPAVGSVLSEIADFGFKALGVATSVSVSGSKFSASEVRFINLCARFDVRRSILLVGSRSCIQADSDRKVYSQYTDGRVVKMTIKILPINISEQRSGDWSLSFQPFFSPDDYKSPALDNASMPSAQGMKHMYLSTTGSASQPLTLQFVPNIHDGAAFQFASLDDPIGQVAIRFDQPVRATYGQFTANDFACQVIISGSMDLRTSGATCSTGTSVKTFNVTVDDKLKDVASVVHHLTAGASQFHILKDDGSYACVDGE